MVLSIGKERMMVQIFQERFSGTGLEKEEF